MSESSEALKAAKIQRRSAKAALTRLGKALNHLCENERPAEEVSDYLIKVEQAFDNVVSRHELYANLIDQDEQFEQEEQWLDECQTFFLKLDIDAKCYIENVSAKISKSSLEENPQNSSGMIGMQNTPSACNTSPEISEPSVSFENNVIDISTPQEHPSINDEISNESVNSPPEFVQNNLEQNASQSAPHPEVSNEAGPAYNSIPCGFQMEKPKFPKFCGDVREYAIFRADFKHAIESRYSKRDAITLLRTCLKEKPLELGDWFRL